MSERHIEYIALSKLEQMGDPVNPKTHHVEGIAGSITELGMIDVIARDDRTDMLVSGHGRVKALRSACSKDQEPPDGVMLAPDGQWLVPVVCGWSSASDEEAREALVGLNRWNERGGWDELMLVKVLGDLDPAKLPVVGYTDQELRDMIDRNHPPSLDALSERASRSRTEDFWPVFRFKIPPELKTRFYALGLSGGDHEQFEHLVACAERERDAKPTRRKGSAA